MLAPLTQTVGLLGAGRMATALARGCLQAGLVEKSRLLASDPLEEARQRFIEAVPGAMVTEDNHHLLNAADVVILAVKPQRMSEVLSGIAPDVQSRHLLVSIAAGVTLENLAGQLPSGTRLVRVMPNTPCLIALGASCYSRGPSASEEDGLVVRQLLESVGCAYEVEEKLLDAVTGLSGSGPAFVYSMIESLAEGGEQMGLSAELALELAAQTTRGAAAMVLATGSPPAELRRQVTSPGGTTVAGLEALTAVRGPEAFRAAVEAATQRSAELGKS